ncbi:hypothetical protein [Stenotrophomonas maltophilia]|uniref:hypothetical protein n=1 Tax=Stenotrophomonas maltophilia TaxID=40324 RepID=UPI0015DFB9E0|nr:hypothetical protein [Stenotrophomonas maltophilia]MBA0361023.1 hypothetical protein [Stenotrophomonas maltophilia]
MAQKLIDLLTQHPTWVGDLFPVAFGKCNDNFTELYAALAAVAAVGGKNMLINCGLPINQRVFAGGALAAGAYGYDRWKAGAGGFNVTINATTGVFTHTSGPLQQIVEAPVLAWGQPLTISVENPSGNISVSVGGATGTIPSGTGRRGVTLTPSGSGNMTVQLTATGVTYSRPQLERGSAATAFDARPVAAELAMCQRYYEKSYPMSVAPGVAQQLGRRGGGQAGVSGSAMYFVQPYLVQKRAVPVLNIYNPSNGAGGGVGNDAGTTVVTQLPYSSDSAFELNWTNAAGRWGGWFHYVADAEL